MGKPRPNEVKEADHDMESVRGELEFEPRWLAIALLENQTKRSIFSSMDKRRKNELKLLMELDC